MLVWYGEWVSASVGRPKECDECDILLVLEW